MEIRIVPKAEAAEWVHSLPPSAAVGMLLAGDRWSCIETTVVAKFEDKIVGIATVAPNGEEMNGEPTVVTIYVLHEYRASGVGYQLLEAAVDYMLSKGLEPIRVDAINSKVLRIIDRLPIEKRQKLNAVDQSMGGMMDAILEM